MTFMMVSFVFVRSAMSGPVTEADCHPAESLDRLTRSAQLETTRAHFDPKLDAKFRDLVSANNGKTEMRNGLYWVTLRDDPKIPEKHRSFVLHRGWRTNEAYLILHGLAESPLGVRQIARLSFNMGANVLAKRSFGHGGNPQDLVSVTVQDLRREVDEGVRLAGLLGDRVIVVGFSLGGILAVDAYQRSTKFTDGKSETIQGMILISPAIRRNAAFDKKITKAIEMYEKLKAKRNEDNPSVPPISDKDFRAFWIPNPGKGHIDVPPYEGYNYSKIPITAYLAAHEMSQSIQPTLEGSRPIRDPVGFIFSRNDPLLDVDWTESFAKRVTTPGLIVIDADPTRTHEGTVRPESFFNEIGEIESDPLVQQFIDLNANLRQAIRR